MVDPETKAILLRVAVVANVVFGFLGFKAMASYKFLQRLLVFFSALRESINVGLFIRSDRTGVHGNFSPPVLWAITVLLACWFVALPRSFSAIFGAPLWVLTLSKLLWHIRISPWHAPIKILVIYVVLLLGLIFGLWLWLFTFFIVVKAMSCLAAIIRPLFSKTVFELLALLLLAISGVLTFILI